MPITLCIQSLKLREEHSVHGCGSIDEQILEITGQFGKASRSIKLDKSLSYRLRVNEVGKLQSRKKRFTEVMY